MIITTGIQRERFVEFRYDVAGMTVDAEATSNSKSSKVKANFLWEAHNIPLEQYEDFKDELRFWRFWNPFNQFAYDEELVDNFLCERGDENDLGELRINHILVTYNTADVIPPTSYELYGLKFLLTGMFYGKTKP